MNPLKILAVEDDDVDMMSLDRAFKAIGLVNEIERAEDGVEAWDFLFDADDNLKPNHPDIILLDLNMPRMSGPEFLVKLFEALPKPDFKIFVLTTSDSDQDIINAYKYDIAGYLLKADLVESLREFIESLDLKWMLVS